MTVRWCRVFRASSLLLSLLCFLFLSDFVLSFHSFVAFYSLFPNRFFLIARMTTLNSLLLSNQDESPECGCGCDWGLLSFYAIFDFSEMFSSHRNWFVDRCLVINTFSCILNLMKSECDLYDLPISEDITF